MRLLVVIGVLGCAGCDLGPPDFELRGLCDSRLQVATEVVASPIVITDDEEGTYAEGPQIVGLDRQASDFIGVTTGDPDGVRIAANRVGVGYVTLVMGKSRKFEATFVIQVTADTVRADPSCGTYSVNVRDATR